jgi:hypothetical protein
MFKIDVQVTGAAEIEAFLNQFPKEALVAAGGALYRRAEHVMSRSKTEFVPVRDGILRDSGYVQPPTLDGGEVAVELGYGGAAKAYALKQHEDLSLNHPNGGQAKYLERPLLEEAPSMIATIAGDIKAELGL